MVQVYYSLLVLLEPVAVISLIYRKELGITQSYGTTYLISKEMTSDSPIKLREARDIVVSHVRHMVINLFRPVLVAIDGRSGSGKSVLGSMVVTELDAALVRSDDFYASYISDAEWDILSPHEKSAKVIDWQRLRTEALEPLLRGKSTGWYAFDLCRVQPDGTYPLKRELTRCSSAAVIVLEGSYSCHPNIADLIDLSVLVDSPANVCHERLSAREDREFLHSWHNRWDVAEEYYFSEVRPKSFFDLVVAN